MFSIALRLLPLCCFFLMMVSCAGNTNIAGPEAEKDIQPLTCVVLFPVENPSDETLLDTQRRQELDNGTVYFQETLKTQLQQSKVGEIIEMEQFRQQIDEISGGMAGLVREIGEISHCNSVLLSSLRRFSQRQGGEYAVDAPASAAFDLRLVDTVTGKSLWVASFSETQESLFSNLFSFNKAQSRGFKWITVEELVARGLQEKLRECPYFFLSE